MGAAVSVSDRFRALTATVRRPRELFVRDWLRGLLLGVLTSLEFVAFNPAGTDVLNGFPALALALSAVVVVLAVRRHFPIAAMVVAVLVASLGPTGPGLVAFASYGVGYRVMRASVASVAIGLISATHLGIWLSRVTPWNQETLGVAVIMLLVVMVPALFGRYHRARAALVMSGWERAERLERERAMLIEQARLRERARIAREMHDSLGHDLSLLALQAGALEVDPALSEQHREAARSLRTTTTEAMERLRGVIGVLREDGDAADTVPTQPTGVGLEELVTRAANSGVDIRLDLDAEDTSGKPPVMAERAIYSAVREAITNATKHAPGAPIVVSIRRREEETTATITNPLMASAPDTTDLGTGLIGLEERIRLAGGELSTDSSGGTFTLTARAPHHELRSEETTTVSAGVLPRYQPSMDELTEMYDRTASVGGLRRRLWLTLVMPIVLAVLGFIVVMTYVGMDRSTMSAAAFAELEVGMDQDAAMAVLPEIQQSPPELQRAEPARPEVSTCRYYAPRRGDWMWPDFDRTYRVCFADGRLVSADLIEHPTTPRTTHNAGAANDRWEEST